MTEEIKDSYLGDGVYASFDGYAIKLDLRGQDSRTAIFIEPPVMENLIKYKEQIEKINER